MREIALDHAALTGGMGANGPAPVWSVHPVRANPRFCTPAMSGGRKRRGRGPIALLQDGDIIEIDADVRDT